MMGKDMLMHCDPVDERILSHIIFIKNLPGETLISPRQNPTL